MVNEESTELQTLEYSAETVFTVGVTFMIIQFLITFLLSISAAFFFDLVASQINFIYLPLMSVNAPG